MIAVLVATNAPAFAAEAGETASNDAAIVVTARHRDERAQDIPVALSVVGGDLLTKTNTTSVADLSKLAPSLSFQGYNPRNTNLNIRGLGNNIAIASDGLDPGVGFYIDGVYYNAGRRARSTAKTPLLARLASPPPSPSLIPR
jgi:iron complex outermembrane receptor protein